MGGAHNDKYSSKRVQTNFCLANGIFCLNKSVIDFNSKIFDIGTNLFGGETSFFVDYNVVRETNVPRILACHEVIS